MRHWVMGVWRNERKNSFIAASNTMWYTWYGAYIGGTKIYIINLTVRQYAPFKAMFWYFLHTSDNKQKRPHHTTIQTNNKYHHHGDGAACPSSGVDSMNPCRPSGERPCACIVWGRQWRILIDSSKQRRKYLIYTSLCVFLNWSHLPVTMVA